MDYSRALPMTQATLLPDFSYKTSQDNEELDSLENTSTIEIQVLFKIYKTQNLKIAAQKIRIFSSGANIRPKAYNTRILTLDI